MQTSRKKKTLLQVFFCKFCEIFKNTFFQRTYPGDCFCLYLRITCFHLFVKFSYFTCLSEAYSERSQTSKMELFWKIVNGWKPLTVFAKSFILDVPLGLEYDFVHFCIYSSESSCLNLRYFYIKYTIIFLLESMFYED